VQEAATPRGSARAGATAGASSGWEGWAPTWAHAGAAGLRELWPLLALTALAAALRLSTIGLQSFWYDEAFTPVHVLHPSLWATMRSVAHTENTPPLWYVLVWGSSRVLGTGVVALRSLSALAGVAMVPVAWGIGWALSGRRAAIGTAALVAVNPLFVWYSQEARAYELFVLTVSLATLCFLRADAEPSPRRMGAFALSGSLALLSHYFAVFLLIPMVLWLVRKRERLRAALPAVGALAAVGLGLGVLVLAQGGHGAQWIERWALGERLAAIPQYYLDGPSGAPLGHGVELLVALPLIVGVGYALWRTLTPAESDGALLMLGIGACGVLVPAVLVAFGADYLAPRNLIGAMIPLTAFLGLVCTATRTGRTGMALLAIAALGFLTICIDVDLSPRLQRGDWEGVAGVLRSATPSGAGPRVIVTAELGAAPLEYYLPGLGNLGRDASTSVREIDEVGYRPLRAGAGLPPARGFRLLEWRDVNGLILYRFGSRTAREVSAATLRAHGITVALTEVLVRSGAPGSPGEVP
jgi:mannosyltransferase